MPITSVAAPDTRIVYASFDRFPSAKGAATHIDAFVRALGKEFGRVELLTVPPESMERSINAALRSADQANIDLGNTGQGDSGQGDSGQGDSGQGGSGQGDSGQGDSVRSEQDVPWAADGVNHHPIYAPGENMFERVLSFRSQSWHWWRENIGADSDSLPIVHFRSIFEGYPIARGKERFCSKLVFEVNGLPSIELKYRYPNVAEDRELICKLRHQEDVCLRAADLVLTVSEVNAECLLSRGVPEDRIRVIPNGVDTDLFAYNPSRPERHDEIIAGSPVNMLYSGTMSAWQGVGVAIEALSLFRRDYPAKLTLVGTARPRQRRDLLQRAWELGVFEHVLLLDPVGKTELAQLHADADVIVAPLTRNDRNLVQGCCPLKVLEAMSSGTPLIASDIPVVRELADNDVEALLVRPGSGKAVKDGMLRLRSESELSARLARAARDRVEREFTWTRATTSLIEAYQWMMETPAV